MSYAHGPSAITLAFDPDSRVLSVSVEHRVGKINEHYIDQVHVKLNDDEIIIQQFESQSSTSSQDVQYTTIDIQQGDEISVTADCNISGKKTVKITINQEKAPEE